jgi:hypothetical protein
MLVRKGKDATVGALCDIKHSSGSFQLGDTWRDFSRIGHRLESRCIGGSEPRVDSASHYGKGG